VLSIEASRSQLELLNAFVTYHYPNEIGPGMYDIHSPRVPSRRNVKRSSTKCSRCCLPGRSGSIPTVVSKLGAGKRSDRLSPIWLLRRRRYALHRGNRREKTARFPPHGIRHRHWESPSDGPPGCHTIGRGRCVQKFPSGRNCRDGPRANT